MNISYVTEISKTGGMLQLGLNDLLKFLHRRQDEWAVCLFWLLLSWIAIIIDYSGALCNSSADPMDRPLMFAHKLHSSQ